MTHRAMRPSTPVIRELTAGDERTVEAVFAGLTPEQRSQRFHVAMPRLPDGHASRPRRRRRTRPGRARRGARRTTPSASAATRGSDARSPRSPSPWSPSTPDAGSGTRSLDALARHAVAAGIEELVFEVTGTNGVALHLARSRGARLERSRGRARIAEPRPVPHATPAA